MTLSKSSHFAPSLGGLCRQFRSNFSASSICEYIVPYIVAVNLVAVNCKMVHFMLSISRFSARSRHRRRNGIIKDSHTTPLDSFDWPARRSMKIIGTSVM